MTVERKRINAALAGDQQAYTSLYKAHSVKTLNMLRQMTRNKEDAEDLLNQTFSRAFLNLSTFDGRSAFATWLFRIAYNEFLQFCRSKKSRCTAAMESLDEPIEGGTFFRDIVGDWDVNQRSVDYGEMIPLLIERLPIGYARVLILHDLYEFRHKEIIGVLQFSMGCSKSQLSRARAKAKKILREAGYVQ